MYKWYQQSSIVGLRNKKERNEKRGNFKNKTILEERSKEKGEIYEFRASNVEIYIIV